MRPWLAVTAAGLLAAPLAAQAPNTLSEAERAAGWVLLFDGHSLDGWRGYGRSEPAGWSVENGAITRTGPGGDLITTRQYGDFELTLEWKIGEGGNSGIFIRGVEDADPRQVPIYRTAPEMQVLDDAKHADGKSPLTSAGSVYGLYPAPAGAARPPGAWNQVRIRVQGDHVQQWFNGVQVADYRLGSEEWTARVKASKFAEWPGYGKAARGYIGLQDHGDWVAFRSIKLRVL